MGIRFYQPYDELRGIVARIYAHETGPSEPGDLRWLIVPDGDVKLIFPFAGAIRCQLGLAERVHPAARLIVSGMRTQPGGLSFPNGVNAIGVIIRPDAAYRLLRVPHLEIANGTFDGEELFDRWACTLQSELSELPREEDRVARLQSRLCERLRRYHRRDHIFEHAVNRLKQCEGRLDIDGLAREVGWSRRHLERTFLERAGIGPKAFASVLRFHAVYKRIRASAGGSYAPLIHDHYYDQSHFLKAFKRYTGITPRVYSGAPDYGRIYIPDYQETPITRWNCPRNCPCGAPKQPVRSQREPTRAISEVEERERFAREIEDVREADFRLANRRLQPLGHLTAARKLSINEFTTYAPADCPLGCP